MNDTENTLGNYDPIVPSENQESQVRSPEGESLNTSSGHISVGVQCSKIESIHDMGIQTEQYPILKDSSTQSDIVQLVDTPVQATTSNCSVTTQTLDDECPNDRHDHQLANYADALAEAQNTIVWQSLMIKILEIEANTVL